MIWATKDNRRLQIRSESAVLAAMKQFKLWFRWIGLVLVCLLFGAWLWAEAEQWLLRRKAGGLLADLESIRVGRSTDAEAQSILGRWGMLEHLCSPRVNDSTCASWVVIRFSLPKLLSGDINVDGRAKNRLGPLVDHVGLRSSAVLAQVITSQGLVISESFMVQTELPIRDWFLRGGAYVPDLLVSSGETQKFLNDDRRFATSSHPNRLARRAKGPYGVIVAFTPEESQIQKKLLMDFRFSCITQLFPCRNEREILSAGAALLDQEEQETQRGG